MSVSCVPRTRFVRAVPPAADRAPPRRSQVGRAVDETAAEDAVVPAHRVEQRADLVRVVAEARVDLEDPVAAGGQRLAVAAHVGVRDAAAFRRPDDPQLRLARACASSSARVPSRETLSSTTNSVTAAKGKRAHAASTRSTKATAVSASFAIGRDDAQAQRGCRPRGGGASVGGPHPLTFGRAQPKGTLRSAAGVVFR